MGWRDPNGKRPSQACKNCKKETGFIPAIVLHSPAFTPFMRETLNKIGAGMARCGLAACLVTLAGNALGVEDDVELKKQLELFRQQNEQLQQQLRQQQEVIDKLNRRVSDLESANQQRAKESTAAQEEVKEPPPSTGLFS